MLTTPSASGSSWSTSRTWSARLSIPVVAARGARSLTLRYGAFPGPGEVPILDRIAPEDPLAHQSLRDRHFPAPACVTLALG